MRASIGEYRAVEEAAMKFVKSVAEGDSRYAKELFVDDAVLFGYLDGNRNMAASNSFTKMWIPWTQERISGRASISSISRKRLRW